MLDSPPGEVEQVDRAGACGAAPQSSRMFAVTRLFPDARKLAKLAAHAHTRARAGEAASSGCSCSHVPPLERRRSSYLMSGAVGQDFLMSALGGKQTLVVAAPATLSPSAHRGKGTRQRGSNYLQSEERPHECADAPNCHEWIDERLRVHLRTKPQHDDTARCEYRERESKSDHVRSGSHCWPE